MSTCAKGLSVTGASLVTAAGLAGIGVSIYLFVGNTNWSQVVGNYQLSFAILFLVISCLITLTGVFGIFGACYNNKCLLHLFWVLLMIWVCGFIAAGIIAIIFPTKVLIEGCRSPTFSTFDTLQTTFDNAKTTYCGSNCACYIANATNRAGLTLASGTTTDAQNVQSCPPAASWTATNTDSLFAALQKAFTCTGWCDSSTSKVFHFSSNNDAAVFPTNTCFNAFSDWFMKYGRYVYITSFVLAGACLILVFCTWAYICQIGEQIK